MLLLYIDSRLNFFFAISMIHIVEDHRSSRRCEDFRLIRVEIHSNGWNDGRFFTQPALNLPNEMN